jgi:hypothetical protein
MALPLLACPKQEPVGDGSTPEVDSGIYLDRPSGPIDPSTITELEVEVQRGFTCNPAAVGPAMKVADVEGAPGEELVIKPAGADCRFHLVHRTGEQESAVSAQGAGYLVAVARRFADGVRVICASEVEHHAGGTGALREVDSVPVRCWASASTSFSVSTVAVPPATDWAAWVRELKPHPTRANAYVLEWAHDFTFQFFNMSDKGRPSTDGLYETVLVWSGTSLTPEPAAKTGARLNPYDGQATRPWTPTPEEMSEFGSFIPFDGGSP